MRVSIGLDKHAGRLIILVTGKSHLIRWQQFHISFLFCSFRVHQRPGRQDIDENVCQLRTRFIAVVIYPKRSSCAKQMHSLVFGFIACGTNFNSWICVCVCVCCCYMSLMSLIKQAKLKWWPCICTCNKISDRSVSVNVILLRALSSLVLFFSNCQFWPMT